jgi:hypothetical protein
MNIGLALRVGLMMRMDSGEDCVSNKNVILRELG